MDMKKLKEIMIINYNYYAEARLEIQLSIYLSLTCNYTFT